jgi:hypothetical protein
MLTMQAIIILFGFYIFCGFIISSIECHWFEFGKEEYDFKFLKIAILWPMYFIRIFK